MKFKSPVYSETSGSIAGITYSHNRGGLYTRARSVPTNPNSPQQQAVRGFVASLTSAWHDTLTTTERAFWDWYAYYVPMPDKLGEPRNVGGIGMYIRSNVPRLQAGLDRVDQGPAIYNLGEFTAPEIVSVTAATGIASIGFTDADDWCDEDGSALLVLASRPQNVTVNYFKGPYRFAGLIEGDAITPPTSPLPITLPFTVGVGVRVFFQFRVTRADGRLALPFRNFGTSV